MTDTTPVVKSYYSITSRFTPEINLLSWIEVMLLVLVLSSNSDVYFRVLVRYAIKGRCIHIAASNNK